MLKRGKKLISLTIALALVMSLFSAMTVSTYAAAYGLVGKYTSESWTGRANSSAMAEVGGNLYAYVGRFTAGTAGGLDVLNVTDPANPVLVETYTDIVLPDQGLMNEKLLVLDNYLYVMNSTRNEVEIYSISETNGTLTRLSALQNQTRSVTMKKVGDLLFVSAWVGNAANASVNVFNISNPASPRLLTPDNKIKPSMTNLNNTPLVINEETGETDTVAEQIATWSIAVLDRGNNNYRIFGTNRARFTTSGNAFFLSIRDITVVPEDEEYYVTTKYEGFVEDVYEGLATNHQGISDIEIIDEKTIALVDGTLDNSVPMLNIIDVTDLTAPKLITSNTNGRTGGDGQGASLIVDGKTLILATKDTRIFVYEYENETLTPVKDFTTGTGMDISIYNGLLCLATFDSFEIYEYKTSVKIDSDSISFVNGVVSGKIEGKLAGDSVVVSVDGKEYNAVVTSTGFSATIDKVLKNNTVDVTASLIRGGSISATTTKTLRVSIPENRQYESWDKLELVSTITNSFSTIVNNEAVTTDIASRDTAGYTIGANKYLYTVGTKGFMAWDVTDIENPAIIQTSTSIKSTDGSEQIKVKDGYLIVVNVANNGVVEFYKINSDGTIPATPATTVTTGYAGSKTITIDIVDDYLFEANQNTARNMAVYDISDIASGVTKLGSTTANEGVFWPTFEKLSDTKYRAYYVVRQNADASNYKLCVNDMTVSSTGTVSFEVQYLAQETDNATASACINSVSDVEYLGNNKVYIGTNITNGTSIIADVSDLENISYITGYANRTRGAHDLGDYYAVQHFTDGMQLYDDTQKSLWRHAISGQVYDISEYDGMLAVTCGSWVYLFDNVYTGIELNGGVIELADNVKIGGLIEGYKSGDSVKLMLNDTEYAATVDANGYFSCDYQPEGTEELEVIALLTRDSEIVAVDSARVSIENEYSDLPEKAVDTALTLISTLTTDSESTALTQRGWSVATAEVNGCDYAYLGTYENLYAIDITTPTAPVVIATYDIKPMSSSKTTNKHITVQDGYLFTENYVAGESAATDAHYVEVYKINNDGTLPQTPVGSVQVSGGGDSELRAVEVIDNYMFVTVGTTAGVVVYDISDLTNIRMVAQETSPNEMTVSLTEKVEEGKYRIYSVVRDSTPFLRITDFVPAADTKMQSKYAGVPSGSQGFNTAETQIVKQNKDTIVVLNVNPNNTAYLNMEYFNVSNPAAPTLDKQFNGWQREQSGYALNDDYMLYGNPEGTLYLHSYSTNRDVASLALGMGQIYQITEHKGMYVMACTNGLAIAGKTSYINIDETDLTGNEAPVLTGKIYGYVEGDAVKAIVGDSEATVTMNSNAFSIDLTEEFETATELGVQLLIERNSENIAGKYIKVKYLGEYPYTITDVSADDGITITLTENFDADGEVKAYVAVYTGNKLDAADIIDVTSTTLTSDVEFNSQTQTLKVFIWNENLKPVAQQVSPEFAAEAGQNF